MPASRDTSQPITRPLIIMAALVVIIAGMRASQPMLAPFLLSLFIAAVAGISLDNPKKIISATEKHGQDHKLHAGTANTRKVVNSRSRNVLCFSVFRVFPWLK